MASTVMGTAAITVKTMNNRWCIRMPNRMRLNMPRTPCVCAALAVDSRMRPVGKAVLFIAQDVLGPFGRLRIAFYVSRTRLQSLLTCRCSQALSIGLCREADQGSVE